MSEPQVCGDHTPASAWGAHERREVLLARERAAAAAAEREACVQRAFAWAASLSDENERLIAAKVAEVIREGR